MSPVSLSSSSKSRQGTAAAVLSAVAMVPILVHVLDDATGGVLSDTLDAGSQGAIIGLALAVQMLFALGAMRESRAGYGGVLVLAGLWVGVSVLDHAAAFGGGDFGGGFLSRLAVWGVVAFQGLAALTALAALRSRRRTSFSGTGWFGS
ncbi:MAG: hypothetical protein ACRDUY_07795 [Nitriliruptorales bacterium]